MYPLPQLARIWSENRQYLKSATVLAGGTAAAQLFGLCIAPFLARLYKVEDFGQYQSYVAIFGIGLSVICLRYDQAVVIAKNDAEAIRVFSLAAMIIPFIAIVHFCAFRLAVGMGLYKINGETFYVLLWLMPVALCCAGVYQLSSSWLLRERRYGGIAKGKMVQGFTQYVLQLLGGLWGAGAEKLIVGDALGRMVAGTVQSWRSLSAIGFSRFRTSRAELAAIARRYREFPLVAGASALVNTLGLSAPVLLLGHFYGAEVLGLFALVDRIMNVPAAIVGQAISQVFQGEISKLQRSDGRRLVAFFRAKLVLLANIAVIPFIAVWLLCPLVISRLFGAQWTEAGSYARILLPMNFISFIAWPVMPTLNLMERQRWQFLWDVLRLAASSGAIAGCAWLGAAPRTCIAVFSAMMASAYLAHIALCYAAVKAAGQGVPAAT